MKRKSLVLLPFALLGAALLFPHPSRSTTCGESCHSDCCGSDNLCTSDEEIKCLTDCLKKCGGKDVPPVPPPAPVESPTPKK